MTKDVIGTIRHKRNLVSSATEIYALLHAAVRTLHSIQVPRFRHIRVEQIDKGQVLVDYYADDKHLTAMKFTYNGKIRKWVLSSPDEIQEGYHLLRCSELFDSTNALVATTLDTELVLEYCVEYLQGSGRSMEASV